MARRWLRTGLLGLGAVAAWELAAVARVARHVDPGGRLDHAARVGGETGERLRLVLLGDSAVDGHGLRVEEALPRQVAARLAGRTGRPVDVRSLAVSGATSADVAAFQLPLLRAAGEVDAVVVGVGVNDALQRVRAEVVADATRAVVSGIRDAVPNAVLVYVPCHDLSGAPGLGPVLGRLLGRRCRGVAKQQLGALGQEGVPTAVARHPGTAEMFGTDGLHPGARGVEVISSLVADALVARDAPDDG